MDYLPKPCVYVCKFFIQEKQFKMGKLATKGHWYTGTKDEPTQKCGHYKAAAVLL